MAAGKIFLNNFAYTFVIRRFNLDKTKGFIMHMLYISYTFILFLLSIFSYAFVDHNLGYMSILYSGFSQNQRGLTAALFILFVFSLFAIYSVTLYMIKKEKLKMQEVKLLIGITVLVLFLSYPAMLSYDIFNYIATAKVSFFYHENPYLIMPIEFIGDPLISFTRAANKVALYGPVWISLTSLPYLSGFGNFVAILFSFKLLNIFFYLSTIILLWKISKNLLTISLFAFNPLVILETLVSAHNDISMMFFALLSFFLLLQRKILLACILLLFSIGIKYATLFLLPVFVYTLFKHYSHQKISWNKIFLWSSISMLLVVFTAPLREEIYPWYGIWFLLFGALITRPRFLVFIYIAFSFGLLLGYTPYLYSGTYSGQTPLLKTIIMLSPFVLSIVCLVLKESIWKKQSMRLYS